MNAAVPSKVRVCRNAAILSFAHLLIKFQPAILCKLHFCLCCGGSFRQSAARLYADDRSADSPQAPTSTRGSPRPFGGQTQIMRT